MTERRFSRQSFLGEESSRQISGICVGLAGLGGGGSHLVQQLAHLGFSDFVIYDPDTIEDTNLNRLIGATEDDVRVSRRKVEIAERLIKGIRERAVVRAYPQNWQDNSKPFRTCDVILGAVDSFKGRSELEAHCRRYFIPLIDIGMDVIRVEGQPPRMAGQVFVSLPGGPCMRCVGLLTESKLAAEAAKYGDAGDVPQVVWANGLLASAAIGMLVDLITDWTKSKSRPCYWSYDGNIGTLRPHPLLEYVPNDCLHYPIEEAGDPVLTRF